MSTDRTAHVSPNGDETSKGGSYPNHYANHTES